MDLDANALLLSFVIGAVGFVAFSYGRKQGRPPQMVVGLVLMVYPYFISNLLLQAGIAVGLIALMWLAIRLGY